ncbi:hypothetical protein Adeg_0016 [Ammonifex degensii KC4]|uniref:Uncharacterized protein n=1 Tax=Ammonifex degensii (strain DSM 10501 / KC4) TaxID=429009 RepID=C9RA84_AMMDK|nr:hypothetical protein Adeg_0016 [Ammonifex degensii KC4]
MKRWSFEKFLDGLGGWLVVAVLLSLCACAQVLLERG